MDIFFIDSKKLLSQVTKDSLFSYLGSYDCKSEKRKIEYSFGRFLLHWVLMNVYKIDNPVIDVVNNKPCLKSGEKFFSISHSKDIIMIAFDDKNLGLDLEFMRKRDYEAIFSHMGVKTNDFSKETFFRFWTEYEAQIKIQGPCRSSCTFKFLDNYMVTVKSAYSFDISKTLKIYEVVNPIASTNPIELINLKLVKDNKKNENMLVAQEISTAFSEFFEPLNLKTE